MQASQQTASHEEERRILRSRGTTSGQTQGGVRADHDAKQKEKERSREEPRCIELLKTDGGQKVEVREDC